LDEVIERWRVVFKGLEMVQRYVAGGGLDRHKMAPIGCIAERRRSR